MDVKKKELDKNELELSITVTPAEMEKFLKLSAERLSKDAKIPGFRPGKAPYDTIVKELGEMKIHEAALDDILTHYFWQAIEENKVDAIGQPKIDIVKFAPGNNLEFKATVALLPQVKIGKYTGLKLKKNEVKVDKAEVDKIVDDLREMRVKEIATKEAAAKGNKAQVDFKVKCDGKPIENGTAEKYPLIIGNSRMIPGFEEEIIGLKAGEEKTFTLKFPENYHDKSVAGKDCEFEVKVHDVFVRELPKLDNEFIKSLGQFKDVKDFMAKVEENIKSEKNFKESQRVEIEMLEKIIDGSEFESIPDILIDAESHKMVHELQGSIEQQGMSWDQYLESIKKDHDGLQAEMRDGAERRVKTSLIMREITDKEKLKVEPGEVDKQLEQMKEEYKDNPQAQENLKSDGYKKYLESNMNNEKVLNFLREKNIAE
ncbi:trigger factor [Patescibacteria group bacterium]|nr:trigger factor [Patescibacteria group bacterium]